jgi:hypothetical protein
LNRGQLAGGTRHSFVGNLWFPGYTCFYGNGTRASTGTEKAPNGAFFTSVVPKQCDPA